ncbi:grasp-with-spasm system ATP-grasp peptide maturase [Chitinophaga sancti]|uniref:grasp-with-spasm system ATP-grasp peptide maturase n=1 Tax=Chitinophaga sancti TaxID=1004 RepID=UPI003F7A650B
MIIIISQAEGEHSTVFVMDWLHYRQASYRRINGSDAIQHFSYHISNTGESELHASGEYLQDITDTPNVIWYRRWMGRNVALRDSMRLGGDDNFINVFNFIRHERSTLRQHFISQVKPIHRLGNPDKDALNKLDVLTAAGKAGLTVPRSIVTADREVLQNFCNTTGPVIVKSLKDPAMLSYQGDNFVSYTAVLNSEDIASLPSKFFPSLVQEQVEKAFEIRIFYLDGQCYAMAIFSQSNTQTQVDFRKYDKKHPNRNVPYTLPPEIISSLHTLMQSLDLNCGSIDMIKSPEGKYYFLEINPVGQFGMVSFPCNYFLEEKIADWLIEKDHP